MNQAQPGILGPVPPVARHLWFSLVEADQARASLRALCDVADGGKTVVGFGQSLVLALGSQIPGLHTFPSHAGAGCEVPSTPFALWCWLRGEDRGELFHRARRIQQALAPAFRLECTIDTFMHAQGRDLTGYEDGTENPRDAHAREVAIVAGQGEELEGSSFVAVQQWLHDLDRFQAMLPEEQDHTIGRRRSDNTEIDAAPPSAHVRRTAQESFEPPAFILRRSMPWVEGSRAGLLFVAFGNSLDPFETLLRRMVGSEDGIADALFRFTRPLSGAYFWCPGLRDGRLNLRLLGI